MYLIDHLLSSCTCICQLQGLYMFRIYFNEPLFLIDFCCFYVACVSVFWVIWKCRCPFRQSGFFLFVKLAFAFLSTMQVIVPVRAKIVLILSLCSKSSAKSIETIFVSLGWCKDTMTAYSISRNTHILFVKRQPTTWSSGALIWKWKRLVLPTIVFCWDLSS